MRKIIVSGSCLDGDCECAQYNGADPEEVGYPPFHNECSCYVTEDEAEDNNQIN